MTQPTNTVDTYDQVGIREDISDIIHNVDPDETPFYSACARTKAANTYHEWQTDSLRGSANNAHIEGDDTAAESRDSTVRLGNYTQIFKNAVITSDTDEGVKKAGRGKEMAYQILQVAKEQKLDIEKALFANNARATGSSTVARELAGLPAWLKSNVLFEDGNSGANPAGDGTNARTDDGTPTDFSQFKFDAAMEKIWGSGGKPDTCYLSSFQMNKALGFVGNNNQRSNVQGAGGKVVKELAVYVTPWGTVKFVPTRENRSSDVFILQSDMFCVASLRPTKQVELAKTGDNSKRQIVTELTLVSKNEKASGLVADNTTS